MKSQPIIDTRLVDIFVETWNELTNNEVAGNGHTLSRHRVNNGWCYQMAILIRMIYGGKLISTRDYSGHAWVRIGTRDYDSDHREGVQPGKIWRFWGEDTTQVCSLKPFQKGWKRYGYSGKVRMDVLKEAAKRFKRLQQLSPEQVNERPETTRRHAV